MTLTLGLLLGSCTALQNMSQYEEGMAETDFLKWHGDAEISKIEGNQKVYRVPRDEDFYLLITFEDGSLVSLEEKEYPRYMKRRNRIGGDTTE